MATEQKETVWIDVRTLEENAARSLPGHLNIPHEEIGQKIAEHNIDLDQPIRLYCRTGRRSGIATDVLKSMGYTDVENAGTIDDAANAV